MDFKIPYVSTRLETDILLTFLLLPLWWVLGFGTFIYQITTLLIFSKLIVVLTRNRMALKLPKPALWYGCFLAAYAASLAINLSSQPLQRILASTNNLIIFLMGFLLMILIFECDPEVFFRRLAKTGYALCFATGFIAVLFLILWFNGNKDFEMPTLLDQLLPGLGKYPFFSLFATVRVTAVEWYGDNPRISIYANAVTATGGIMLLILPLAWAHIESRGKMVFSDWVMNILSLVTLGASISRSAITGLVLAVLIVRMAEARKNPVYIFFILAIGAFISQYVADVFQWILNARADSTVGRFELYQEAVRIAWEQNPLMGIGVRLREEHTMMAIGTHSTYVELFLVTGFLGLFFFVLFQSRVFAEWLRLSECLKRPYRIFWRYLGIASIGIHVWILTEAIDGLPYMTYGLFLIYGSILLLRRQAESPGNLPQANS